MTGQDLVHKLTSYYNGGKYSAERLTELDRFCEGIADRDREAIYEAITDTRSMNTPIAKADVREACVRVGIPYKVTQYLADLKVTCDCCSEQFKYNPAPTDDQELNFGVHNHCPNCGFQYGWTTQAKATLEAGKEADWYDEYLAKFRANGYGRGKHHGPWFQRSKELKAIEDDKKETLQNKVEAIRSKIKVEAGKKEQSNDQ